MERVRLTKDNFEEAIKERTRLMGGALNVDFKDFSKDI